MQRLHHNQEQIVRRRPGKMVGFASEDSPGDSPDGEQVVASMSHMAGLAVTAELRKQLQHQLERIIIIDHCSMHYCAMMLL